MLDGLLGKISLEQSGGELECVSILDEVLHEEDGQEGHWGHLLGKEEAARNRKLMAPSSRHPVNQPQHLGDRILEALLQIA